jgi:zinc transport system permease protein
MLELAFMQRALAAAVVVGVLCGALGFFVVLRRLAFIGVGISHSAIGGVAIAVLLGWNPLLTAAIFAAAVALGIAWVGRRSPLSEDAVIGVFFSGSMALGIVLFSLRRGYQQDLFGYLFGNVLAITGGELVAVTIAAAGVLAALALAFRPLLLVALDEEVARAYGQPVGLLDGALLVLLALAIVIGVRLVGVILVEALLVVPAATATLWSGHYRGQLGLAMALGAGSGVAGLALAFALDLAAGATIVMVAVVGFFASWALRTLRRA